MIAINVSCIMYEIFQIPILPESCYCFSFSITESVRLNIVTVHQNLDLMSELTSDIHA